MTQRVLTTESGAPVADNQNSATAGVGGPLLLQDQHLLEKLARFNRERVPERVVHARGSGAYGYFEVTDDVTGFTSADFLAQVGRRTETFLRFSTVADSLGGADAVRDPRGFAVKFYTTDGNYDLVGNNTPVFFVKDPLKFPDFIHSQKRDPFTGRQEPDNVWDFWAHSPEATHQVPSTVPASRRRSARCARTEPSRPTQGAQQPSLPPALVRGGRREGHPRDRGGARASAVVRGATVTFLT